MRKLTAIALTLFLFSNVAKADTMIDEIGDFQLWITDPVNVGSSEDLVSATLYGVNTGGEGLSSFSGEIGVGGGLHHEQFFGGVPVPSQIATPTAALAADSSVDSHFVLPVLVPVNLPAEGFIDDTSSTEPGDFDGPSNRTGFDAVLSADVGMADAGNPAQTTVNLAQLVAKGDTNLNLDFLLGTPGGSNATFTTAFMLGGTPPPSFGIELGPGITDLNQAIQDAFSSGGGGPIVLDGAVSATGTVDPADIVGAVTDINLGGVTGTLTDDDMDGTFDLVIDGNWNSIPPSSNLTGNLVLSAPGQAAAGLPFSVTVPEPSTVALVSLALVGLAGYARRK